jgi:hypothetical protein
VKFTRGVALVARRGWTRRSSTLAHGRLAIGGRVCYEALAKRASTPDWAFMNYGYAPATVDAVGTPPLRSSDERDRLCIQLYLHAIDHSDMRGKDVLEVGSGRGGGASYISRYLQPRSETSSASRLGRPPRRSR